MIHIAVCDDDLPTTELIERLILDTQKNISEKIEVSIFYSGEGFSKAIQSSCTFDIVLMDIEMEGMDGIKAGHALRGNDDNDLVQLIYISSYEEYHLQLFDVQPSGFIKKPIDPKMFKNKLIPSIQKAFRNQQQGKKNFLLVDRKGQQIGVPYRDILYLESKIRKINLYTNNEIIEYYSTLSIESSKLPDFSFIRIHQSYIVNSYCIREIHTRKVVLSNGQILPISEKKSAAARKSYLNFRGNLLG